MRGRGMTDQPEALRVAAELDALALKACGPEHLPLERVAARLLREQHAEIDRFDDKLDYTTKGLAEWREEALRHMQQAKAARATARVAIGHLQGVLGLARTHAEQQAADTAARDWLESIGNDSGGET